MNKLRLALTVALSLLACIVLITACTSIDYGEPTTYPNDGNLVSSWEAFAGWEDTVILEEVFYFYDNGEYYMYNHHYNKGDVAETGTWTGSLEPGGEIVMTVQWYRGTTKEGEGFFHEVSYSHLHPPFEYVAEISMDGQTLTAERWDYTIRNEYGYAHSGATHKDYNLQVPKDPDEEEDEEELQALFNSLRSYYFAWMDARNN
ncbi:MAG: hypothetical protein FWG89_02790 [Treponema sp.]|nr:hypothetical protein [Treponema sp.]